MASFKEHIEYVTQHGLAHTNRFQVIIPLPAKLLANVGQKQTQHPTFLSSVIKNVSSYLGGGSSDITRGLDIMIDSTEIPGKSLTTTEVKYNGDFYKLPYSNVYESQQMTFKVSNDMYEKNIIDEWMDLIFDPTTHYIGYADDYSTDITINQLNQNDQIVYSVTMKNAFPMLCSPLPLSNDDRDTYAKLQTQFVYRRWTKTNDSFNNSGITSLSQTPLGPILSPYLGNPAVQAALNTVKDTTGLNLQGEAVNIYNQLDTVVKGSVNTSINKTASIVSMIKAHININDNLTSNDQATLINKADQILNNLRS